MLRVAGEYAETLTGMGRKEVEFARPLAEVRQGDGRVNVRRLRELLQAEGSELEKEARHLKAQLDEGRERAEQFKERVDQLEAALAQARREQFLDPVTGIPDRYAFMAHLHRHLDRSLHLGETFSLLLFHFYELQPLLGKLHSPATLLQGNGEKRLLLAMIQEMRPHLPENAFLARLSTERVVVLLPKCTVQMGEAMGVVVCQTLEETTFMLDERALSIQVSSGCAAFQSGMNVAQMLETTDRLAAAAHGEREKGQGTALRVRNC
jgi:GGDEF domain-containing protein